MVLQKKFQQSQEQAIASYDWVDVAEGTGSIIFYGLKSSTSGAEVYKLSTLADYSSSAETWSTDTALITMNFDSQPFNIAKNIRGTAYVSIPFRGGNGYGFLKVQIKKLVGATETNISEEIIDSKTSGAASAGRMSFLPIALTQTHIKEGEQIRITVKLINENTGSATYVGIGHDPQNRDGTYVTTAVAGSTIMKTHIPFQLDL